MTWATACATLRTFIVTCFTSPCSNVGTECTDVEAQAETTSWREKMVVHCQGSEALTLRLPVQKGQPHVTGENTITHV